MVKRVAYQGILGAFSYMTALRCFGPDAFLLGCSNFREVFEAVKRGDVDMGLLPIENTLAGSITENYDLLLEYPELQIVGEAYTPVHHALLALEAVQDVHALKKVLSHPKALEQCVQFFRENQHLVKEVYYDTAAAASTVAKMGDTTLGAIAHACNADIYGLKVLQDHIEDDPGNTTRFIVISPKAATSEQEKCTLTFTLDHTPGALASALKRFEGFNLMKIESRPIKDKPFEYRFYIDIECSDPQMIQLQKNEIILGIYGKL